MNVTLSAYGNDHTIVPCAHWHKSVKQFASVCPPFRTWQTVPPWRWQSQQHASLWQAEVAAEPTLHWPFAQMMQVKKMGKRCCQARQGTHQQSRSLPLFLTLSCSTAGRSLLLTLVMSKLVLVRAQCPLPLCLLHWVLCQLYFWWHKLKVTKSCDPKTPWNVVVTQHVKMYQPEFKLLSGTQISSTVECAPFLQFWWSWFSSWLQPLPHLMWQQRLQTLQRFLLEPFRSPAYHPEKWGTQWDVAKNSSSSVLAAKLWSKSNFSLVKLIAGATDCYM